MSLNLHNPPTNSISSHIHFNSSAARANITADTIAAGFNSTDPSLNPSRISDPAFVYIPTSFATDDSRNSFSYNDFNTDSESASPSTQWLNTSYTDFMLNASTANGTATALQYELCDSENPFFNCTPQMYLEYEHGPQRLPLQRALMVTMIFGGIFITGVLGNVLVCVVIVRHSMMHTATNYYLFSLALSDLLYLLFGLPAEVFHHWHQYPYLFGLPFCKMRAFISEASSYVSVLTILAFSMERFLAICHPLHLYAMSGFKRALRIITVLWILSFVCAIPFALMTDILYLHYPKDNSPIYDSAYCSVAHLPENLPVFELSFCIFFVIPMVLIIILYGGMGAKIRSRTVQQLGVQQGSMHRESRHQQSKKTVIRMLAAVVITFFICWLPFHLQRLWFLYGQSYENSDEINEWMFSLTGFTYYVSCTINPILYNVMSRRYRSAFKDTLCGKRKSVCYNNGLLKDQSSFRETTQATSLGNSGTDRSHSVRIRSMRQLSDFKERNSFKANNSLLSWSKKTDCTVPSKQNFLAEDSNAKLLQSNVVVVADNSSINGQPRLHTENVLEANLVKNSAETCI